ncbi:hypothetical protein SERLADRAFT_413502 [Serpula lacrymans var. lacrymans S7.9]|uniref:Nephrocystin 3-like N-terminal domain-containing protein n=1 Tax=Serpula lacrymans var. lacrymans (strain S7.9) TaxID=578457 RepID=F8NK29_SERL9|nr:uncharacterized protein SERLADRAFT_413502 [Serpula lacrymans var. lacrymans S7.9]EGO28713.1 hypothetical protein SERLADRAFT_413502 [Serpula lacrymans var. lacrymans S7.9]
MSDHNRLNPHIPQPQRNTETSGNPHHIEQNTFLSGSSAGMFNHSANTHVQHMAAMPSLYELLQPVNASYRDRAGKRARCLQGTRKDVLTTIQKWVDQLETSQPICWLNGPAGFGKSTIAQTIAEWCADQKRLAASFFFFRGMGHREKMSHLIPTLAFQLSSTVRGMEPLLKNALDKEPYILNTPLNYQFDILIMEPIIVCNRKRLPVVIVIDALDECIRQGGVSMEEFIDVVIDACGARKSEVPFRLFITSRIEEHLRKKLETPDAEGVILQLKLQNFDATEDIRMFFQSEFKRIYHANRKLMLMDKVPQPWPSPEILDVLVKKAAGSYIYSSTFVDFVSEKGGMPHQKLLDALKAHGLDNLYSQVFSNALYPGGTPVAMAELVRIMGVLLLLRYTLSIKELATFLNIPPRTLVEYFLSIQSILLIPESDIDPVQLVHTSLRDFLMIPARSGTYFIDPPIRHISIAIGCLDIMTKNKTEFLFEKEPLQYASTEWLAHLRKALCEGDQCPSDLSLFVSLKDSLTSFASSSLDPWLHSMIVYTMRHGMESRFPPLELSQCPQSLQSTLTSLYNMLDQTIFVRIVLVSCINH